MAPQIKTGGFKFGSFNLSNQKWSPSGLGQLPKGGPPPGLPKSASLHQRGQSIVRDIKLSKLGNILRLYQLRLAFSQWRGLPLHQIYRPFNLLLVTKVGTSYSVQQLSDQMASTKSNVDSSLGQRAFEVKDCKSIPYNINHLYNR